MPHSFPTPRSAYVHVPFCRHRCGYCNFTLIAGRDDLIADYLRAIELEMRSLGPIHPVDTLFFGGGTPTHLPEPALETLLELAGRYFPLQLGGEFSVEANPADISPPKIALLARYGVNRLSLGVQSFDPDKLNILERDHNREVIAAAVATARPFIHNLAIDLIFAAPGESLAAWQQDLAATLELAPAHVSTYGLTYERGTSYWNRLQRGELISSDEELERAQYEQAIDTLTGAGFEHYEVSNFARRSLRCRHNEAYWNGDGYFAVGPGAASYVAGRRAMNHRSTTTWLKRVLAGQSAVAESETLTDEERAREMLVFGMRRLAGVERATFAARTGFTLDVLVEHELTNLVAHGLIIDDGAVVRLTRAGLLVSDSIWTRFLRPSSAASAVPPGE